MKTIEEIDYEINDAVKECTIQRKEGNKTSRLESRISELRQLRLYLLSGPREEYIKAEIVKIQNRIDNIDSHYSDWQVGKVLTSYKDPYAAYLTQMGLSSLKIQLKSLKYILSE